MIALETSTYLGPARVLQTAPGRIKIELRAGGVSPLDEGPLDDSQPAWATSALAFPYRPAIGDIVLAVGSAGQWYVIGVLKGSGMTTLVVPGDLTVSAPRGRMTFEAADGVEIRSPEIRMTANRWEIVANAVSERFHEAVRWVRDTFQLRAGRLRTRVDTTYDLQAERIKALAEREVRIDGSSIDLG